VDGSRWFAIFNSDFNLMPVRGNLLTWQIKQKKNPTAVVLGRLGSCQKSGVANLRVPLQAG